MTKRAAMAVVLAFLPSAAGLAKCANIGYTVSGVVKDFRTGEPLPAAQIVCLADDETNAWRPDVDGPAVLSTDATGGYHALYYFNTYSGPGLIFSDRCTRRLKRLMVVISHAGYIPARVVLERSQIPKVSDDFKANIQVPVVALVAEGSSCCPS